MFKNKSILAIIPARGGSKGVTRKNMREVGGKTLLQWTVDQAQQSRYLDRTILSSEDPEIIDHAKLLGCEVPFIRPSDLSLDETPSIEPVLHALDQCAGYDYVVLLQLTSPLRLAVDIDSCIEHCINSAAPSCVSVTSANHPPEWMFTLKKDLVLEKVMPDSMPLRRQDSKPVFTLNGAVYVARIKDLQSNKSFIMANTMGYTMPVERSLDLDTEYDFFLFESYLRYCTRGL